MFDANPLYNLLSLIDTRSHIDEGNFKFEKLREQANIALESQEQLRDRHALDEARVAKGSVRNFVVEGVVDDLCKACKHPPGYDPSSGLGMARLVIESLPFSNQGLRQEVLHSDVVRCCDHGGASAANRHLTVGPLCPASGLDGGRLVQPYLAKELHVGLISLAPGSGLEGDLVLEDILELLHLHVHVVSFALRLRVPIVGSLAELFNGRRGRLKHVRHTGVAELGLQLQSHLR